MILLSEDKFQEHVLKSLDEIKGLFIKNERDHGELSSKIESVRTEVESVRTEIESVRTEVESIRTEIHKTLNSQFRWYIGTSIGLATLVFAIVKYVVN